MNHYANQATMLIRLVGSLMILIELMGMVYWILASFALEPQSSEHTWKSARALSAIVFILVGILLYILGKPIGRRIGSDLDE